jgi:hypothetical protein
MAYMLNYKGDKTPYEDWLKMKQKVIFQYHEHYLEDCMHSIFRPSLDGNSGLYYFTLNGDLYTKVYANVLIDIETKTLYIYSATFSHINYYGDSNKNIKNGNLVELHEEYPEDHIGYYKSFLLKFFGKDWKISYDYTPRIHKRWLRKYRKTIHRIERAQKIFIPNEIKDIIVKKCSKWTNDQMFKITKETQVMLSNIYKLYGGAVESSREETRGLYLFPWNKTLALYLE